MTTRKPAAPADLAPRGRAFWRRTVAVYELSEVEVEGDGEVVGGVEEGAAEALVGPAGGVVEGVPDAPAGIPRKQVGGDHGVVEQRGEPAEARSVGGRNPKAGGDGGGGAGRDLRDLSLTGAIIVHHPDLTTGSKGDLLPIR